MSLAVVATAALLFGVFVAGAYAGFYQWWLMDSSARATLLAGELRTIREGNSDILIATKEIELDGAIVRAMQFQESGHPWLFWPFEKSFEHERFLRSVAEYRKLYPSSGMPAEAIADAEDRRVAEEFAAEVVKRNAQLLRQYAK